MHADQIRQDFIGWVREDDLACGACQVVLDDR